MEGREGRVGPQLGSLEPPVRTEDTPLFIVLHLQSMYFLFIFAFYLLCQRFLSIRTLCAVCIILSHM